MVIAAGALGEFSDVLKSAPRVDTDRLRGRGLLSFSELVLVLLSLDTTAFRRISQLTECNNRKRSHSPLLLRGEGLIERPPRIGELLKVRPSLSQCIGALAQEVNRIAVAQVFDGATVT